MSDPTRLVDGDGELEKALLRSWSARQPSDEAHRKALAAVGLGGTLLTAGASTSLAPKAAVVSSTVVKWLALFGGVVMAAAVVFVASRQHKSGEAPPVTASSAPVFAAQPVPVPAPSAASPVGPTLPTTAWSPVPRSPAPTEAPSGGSGSGNAPSTGVVPSRAAFASPVATGGSGLRVAPKESSTAGEGTTAGQGPASSSTAASTAPPAAQASTLDEEIHLVDLARRALTVGDAPTALRVVDGYDAKYPAGALTQEAAELRIEALFRLGRRDDAERLAAKFMAAHPSSPYVRTIRALEATAAAPAP
jgi:hypothetical protein